MIRVLCKSIVAIGLALHGAAQAQISIVPSSPKLRETVRVQVQEGVVAASSSDTFDFRATRISMSGNRITVALVNMAAGPFQAPSPRVDFPLGQFPAGAYEVDVRLETPGGTLLRSVGSGSFSVAQKGPEDPLWNLTDLWWNPEESGWGMNIVQHPSGVVFATWFVYGSDGKAIWYVVPNARPIGAGSGFLGDLYRTTGPDFCYQDMPCTQPYDPARVSATPVGRASIGFVSNDYDRLVVSFFVDGKTLTRFVRRQSF